MSNINESLNIGKSVLITGCSSGIGWHTAVNLAKNGFTVFATVRKEAAAESLRKLNLSNLVAIYPLDLTNRDQILKAVDGVTTELSRRGQKGLYALINNAGGGSPAPIEIMNLDKFQIELQTRLVGAVVLIQSFLPSIRQVNGRIVWIMTPALMPTPYVASIHACDFAANCIARTLAIELKSWKIPVIMIRCGGIKTPAGLRTVADVEAVLQEKSDRVNLYEEALREWGAEMAEFDRKRTNPDKVANVVLKALEARKPHSRYSIGHMVRAANFFEKLPQSIGDWILKLRF